MTPEPNAQSADSLLAELLLRTPVVPDACRDDLGAALALVRAAHDNALRSAAAQLGDFEADLRRVGLGWATARQPLDPLLDLVSALNEKMLSMAGPPGAAVVTETGGLIIRAILTGFQHAYQWTPRDRVASDDRRLLAAALLWDLDVPPDHRLPLAESYAVIAIPHGGKDGAGLDADELVAHFDRSGISDALPLLADPLSYVLVPSPDKRDAARLARQLYGRLPNQQLLALAWRRRAKVPSGRQEARDIARIVAVSERPPGVYQLDDVLVEYAVLQEPSVADRLVRVVTPLGNLPMLLTTLSSFIAANGNRSKAAGVLDIHRSTLDYRLQRIEQLTGTDPTSAGGLQLLSIALTTYTALLLPDSEPGPPG